MEVSIEERVNRLEKQMSVGELITLLSELHPDEKIALYSEDGHYLIITGLNTRLTQMNDTPVLNVVNAEGDKPIETTLDALERQKRAVETAIQAVKEEERQEALEQKKIERASVTPKRYKSNTPRQRKNNKNMERYYRKKAIEIGLDVSGLKGLRSVKAAVQKAEKAKKKAND